MSLPARERRSLSGIQVGLGRSDPHLVSLFATFSRLTREEEMPHIERLRVRVDRVTERGRQFRRNVFTRIRLIIITQVVLSAICAALLIISWRSGPSTCKVNHVPTNPLQPTPA